mgnify:CR=1 FL=1
MNIIHRPDWALPESAVTPERAVLDRRALMLAAGAGALAASAGPAHAQRADQAPDPSASLYPAPRNPAFREVDRPITAENAATTYNNFYEFGSHKQIWRAAQALRIRPWEIRIEGEVERPFTIAIDDLLRRVTLEERVYRLRCVEAWAMVVPWVGFPMADLLRIANPTSRARYVRFDTFHDAQMAPGQRQFWYQWPYVEGLSIAEANHPLSMMVTGAYGKPLPRQMGAPIRMIVPWKYGFKSGKSINRIVFQAERPKTFWIASGPDEYGFWANVNPAVPHPRWSQSSERMLGTDERRPTLPYNGYAAEVAGLYAGMTGERLYM